MRFTEWENPENGNLEWLIRKDGCMHCDDPGCLKACPAPGAIVQYSNGIVDFVQENCIGCGYCVKGCPFNIPRISKVDDKAYKCTLCSDRVAVGQVPACAKACPTQAITFGTKDEMIDTRQKRIDGPQVARLRQGRVSTIRRASAARTSCTCCTMPTGRSSTQGWRRIRASAPSSSCGRARPSTPVLPCMGLSAVTGAVHHLSGRCQPCQPKDDEAKRRRSSRKDVRHDERRSHRRCRRTSLKVRRYSARRARQPLGHRHQLRGCWRCAVWPSSIRPVLVLTALFGGGENMRWLHPWFGVVLAVSFFGLFIRFLPANLPRTGRWHWLVQPARCALRSRRIPARGRQVQRRPEGGVLADVAAGAVPADHGMHPVGSGQVVHRDALGHVQHRRAALRGPRCTPWRRSPPSCFDRARLRRRSGSVARSAP